jgi:hypothetical protein
VTQILTCATPQYIVQVSDRLVSISKGGGICPIDQFANKAVVYCATDA